MLRKFREDRKGSTAIEFAIVASVISVAALGAFQALGQQSGNQMSTVESAYAEANR